MLWHGLHIDAHMNEFRIIFTKMVNCVPNAMKSRFSVVAALFAGFWSVQSDWSCQHYKDLNQYKVNLYKHRRGFTTHRQSWHGWKALHEFQADCEPIYDSNIVETRILDCWMTAGIASESWNHLFIDMDYCQWMSSNLALDYTLYHCTIK